MSERQPPGPPRDDTGRIVYGYGPVHDAMQKQIADLLASADIGEEERQQILIALSCPCCGTSGLSFSLKLKDDPDPTPSF